MKQNLCVDCVEAAIDDFAVKCSAISMIMKKN